LQHVIPVINKGPWSILWIKSVWCKLRSSCAGQYDDGEA